MKTALMAAAALLIGSTQLLAQDRGRGKPAEPPTLRGKVGAYEADVSITVETRLRGGQVEKTEFSIVKGKTLVELGTGVKAIEVGGTVSVWADKENPKAAAKVVAEPEAPTVQGKVTAYEADKTLVVERKTRSGDAKSTEFSLVKGRTVIELGTGVKALEVGQTVSVWAEKDDPKAAARVAVQGAAPGGRGRGAAPAESPKPAPAPAPKPEEPREPSADAEKVLKAYKENLPTDKKLEWYTLDWVNTLGEAKERAAREKRPILWIQTNREGDLFCSLC